MILTFAGNLIHFGGRQSFQDFYLPGLRVVLVGRYFTIGPCCLIVLGSL
jgi:hypothetical protein